MYKIVKKEILNSSVTLMEIEAPLVSKKAKAGQFIILRVDEYSERIPLTIADFDTNKGTVTIIFQIVGASTILLNTKNVGDYLLDFVGPLGKASEIEGLKKVCVVAGGVGSAIALPLVKALKKQGSETDAIAGFRNKDLVILENEFKNNSDKFILCTDDGSAGITGNVTKPLEELLNKENYDVVYTIGPLIMMKYVCLLTKKYNTKTIVSMNPIMVDGSGMCGACRLTVDGKVRFACVEGPDFDGHLVDFDEVINRNNIYKTQENKKREELCNLLKLGDNHG